MVVVFHHPPWIYENLVESGVDHMDEARTFLYSVEKELKDFLNWLNLLISVIRWADVHYFWVPMAHIVLKDHAVNFELLGQPCEDSRCLPSQGYRHPFHDLLSTPRAKALVLWAVTVRAPRRLITTIAATDHRPLEHHSMSLMIALLEALRANNACRVDFAIKALPSSISRLQRLRTSTLTLCPIYRKQNLLNFCFNASSI